MGQVYSHMTMSLDGYIADPQDGCDELFGWYGAGDVTVPTAVGTSPSGSTSAAPNCSSRSSPVPARWSAAGDCST